MPFAAGDEMRRGASEGFQFVRTWWNSIVFVIIFGSPVVVVLVSARNVTGCCPVLRDKPIYVHCAFKGKSPYIVVVGLHRGESNKNADDDELEWTDEKGNPLWRNSSSTKQNRCSSLKLFPITISPCWTGQRNGNYIWSSACGPSSHCVRCRLALEIFYSSMHCPSVF